MMSNFKMENRGVFSSISSLDARQVERELCKRDVCMYCGGRALGYKHTPNGPNEAGNWTHQSAQDNDMQQNVLCVASSIFSRERFEIAHSPKIATGCEK